MKGGARALRPLLLLPTAAWVAAFFLVPLAMIVAYSFATISLITLDVSFGLSLANYRELFDPLYLSTLGRSVVLALGATAGCLVLALPLAFFISRQPPRWQRVLLVAVIVPFWSSFIVRIYAVARVIDDGGPLEDALWALSIGSGDLGLAQTRWAIGVGIVYSYLPLMVLPIYVALDRVDRSLLDAAADLGAPARRGFRRVTLPLALPGVLAGCVIVGIPALGEYVIPDVLGGGKTLMLGNVVADQFLKTGNLPFGSAVAVALLAVMAIVLIGQRLARQVVR